MKKLENKTVFITGGLSGIGKACAMAAAKEGANIAVADLSINVVLSLHRMGLCKENLKLRLKILKRWVQNFDYLTQSSVCQQR